MKVISKIFIICTTILVVFAFALIAVAQFDFNIDFLNLKKVQPTFFEPLGKIKLEEVWNKINETNPVRFVKIGIIDSGIDASGDRHPEFRNVELGNTPANAKTDVAKGDVPGAAGGHGTQVTGIIGANNISFPDPTKYVYPQMNGILSGMHSLSYTLEVRKPTFIGQYPVIFSIASKIEELLREKVNIINISIGSTVPLVSLLATRSFSHQFNNATDTLFIVSAGQFEIFFEGIPAELVAPANLGDNFSNVITVGATNLDDTRMSSSNFGSAVGIAAPGLPIYAPAPRGKGNFPRDTVNFPADVQQNYDNSFGGTSASAPMVTGVAGLVKAIKPDLTPSQIKQILIETGDPISTDKPIGPRLNAYKAICDPLVLNCAPPPPCVLSGTLNSDITLISGQTCTIQGTLTIPNGISLNVNPAVILKFASPDSKVIVNGTLNANGIASQPIYFTSIKDDSVGGDTNNDGTASTPAPQDWQSIVINSTGAANFNYSTIRYGSFGFYLYGGNLSLSHSHLTRNSGWSLYVNSGTADITSSEIDHSYGGIVQSGGTITVSQSSIHDNTSDGIFAEAGTLTVTSTNFQKNDRALFVSPAVDFVHSGNTAINNNVNGIVMNGSTIADRTWTKDLIPYVIYSEEATSTVTISSGTTLTIDPGVVIKFAFPNSRIIVNGTLNANGTASQLIYFTSIKDDSVGGDTNNDDSATSPAPGDWGDISINSTGTANFNYSTIRFGSFNYLFGGNLSLSHSHLTQNSGWPIWVSSGIASITSSEIDHSYGGIAQGGGTVTVSQSSIHDNTSYGAFSNGPNIMNAQNNFWGDSTGPFHPTLNPSGLGNPVSDYVDFLPFLTSDPVGSLP